MLQHFLNDISFTVTEENSNSDVCYLDILFSLLKYLLQKLSYLSLQFLCNTPFCLPLSHLSLFSDRCTPVGCPPPVSVVPTAARSCRSTRPIQDWSAQCHAVDRDSWNQRPACITVSLESWNHNTFVLKTKFDSKS